MALTGKSPEEAAELMEYINGTSFTLIWSWRLINGTPTWIYRLNKKPSSIEERVIGFFADSNWAFLYCGRDPECLNSRLGVSAAKN